MDWMVERRCPATLLAVSIVLGAAAPLTLGQAAGRAPAAEMAPDPDQATEGRLLVVNRRDNTLMVIDVPSYAIQATIPVGQEPHEVVVTPDGRKAYVSNGRDRTISVVDLKGPRVVRTLRSESFDSLNGLAMTPDGRHLILTSEGSRRFFLVDASRDVVLRSLTTTQARAHMVVVPGNGTRAFAANVGSDSVTILKIPELRIVKNVPVGDGPEGIAVTPNGRWVLVALQGVEQVAILANLNTFGDPNAAPATKIDFKRISQPELRREGITVGIVEWQSDLMIGRNRSREREYVYFNGQQVTQVPRSRVTALGQVNLASGAHAEETLDITPEE